MSKIDGRKTEKKLSSVIGIPWVRKSVVLGVVATVISLIIVLILKTLGFDLNQVLINAKSFFKSYGIIGIFISTILAGTVIPLGSPVLVTVAASFGLHPLTLIIVSTTGFTIGMVINYGLACKLGRPYVLKKISEEKLKDVSNMWAKWGWIIYVFFGVIPVLPVELLSLLCGLLKARFDIFLVLTFTTRLILFTILVYFGGQIGVWLGVA
ncbi:MAG: VTT domain-containing protein [Candidatus Bathyarchaeia archaeon]